MLAQDSEPKIPVLNMVDAKLFAGKLDGFRYDDMPDDRETWRRVALGLDAAARQHGSPDFAGAPEDVQRRVIHALQISIGLRNRHHRAVAVNGVTTGCEVPASPVRVLGQLACGLRQGFPGT